MKSLVRIGFLLGVLVGGIARGQEQQIPWTTDFRQACQQGNQDRRLVLLHFYTDECEPCERVERNVFSRPEVAAAIARNYVPVKVHAAQNPELARRYQVTRFPTDVAVTPAGLEIHRSTSPQLAEHYVELCDLMALKAGVGTGQQWAANMQQVGQATLSQAGAAAQGAVAGGQQQWNQLGQQAAGGIDQTRGSTQEWSQQAQDAANQFGQQTQTAVQQYQRQAQGAAQQFQTKAADSVQRFQEQTQVAGQQVQNSAQQLGDRARSTMSQWSMPPVGDLRAPAPAAAAAIAGANLPQAGAIVAPTQQSSMTNPFFGQQPAASPGMAAAQPPSPSTSSFAPAAPREQQFIAASQAPPVCLDGFCPVTLLETKKWKKADPQFGAIHRGRTYLFASAQQQTKFLANPDAFAPVLSGYDPVRLATTGQLVEGKRAHGLITNGDNRIFLFADEASLEQFKRSQRDFAEQAYQAMQRSETTPTYR
jgi:YHS domain-containing protein/thiol-disulfide isomerase/thioredoxin